MCRWLAAFSIIMKAAQMDSTLQLGGTQIDSSTLAELCRRFGVRELSLFGSAARGELRADSDIDVMVEFEPGIRIGLLKFQSLIDELDLLIGRKVDLVTKRGLKPWVRTQVLKDAASFMRPEPAFLKDILSACRKIESIVAVNPEDTSINDEVLSAAVLHHLTVTGEAINRLPVDLREPHPQVPWRQIIAFRHRTVHACFDLDWQILWDTATEDISQLRLKVLDILTTESPDSGLD